jgi:hypothetical protein
MKWVLIVMAVDFAETKQEPTAATGVYVCDITGRCGIVGKR